MLDILQREFIYIWYYFDLQLRQIFLYWVLGIVIGSVISVFGKQKIHLLMTAIQDKHLGILGIIPASWNCQDLCSRNLPKIFSVAQVSIAVIT